jgi:hypothetical protein
MQPGFGSVLMRLTPVSSARSAIAGGSIAFKRHELRRLGPATASLVVHALLIAVVARLTAMHQVATPTPDNKPTT